jgi:thiamine phosphate synthase YjbQ (UPF0047 family)
VQEIRLKTDRRTQLVDITKQVQERLDETNGAAAALVYVPHTTGGRDDQRGSRPGGGRRSRVRAGEGRRRRLGLEARGGSDGPNAPSHIRASLMSPQIMVPLDDGKLALGTWQGSSSASSTARATARST